MAKQGGIHKIRGKIGEASYYQSQVGGYLIRGINQGMSERVKNDPAFANTRLNAAEFGGAGKLAGAMVSAVSQRWRYMLSPTATGQMSSAIKRAMEQDTTNPWGEREVLLGQMPGLQEVYNSLSKNEMLPELSEWALGCNWNEESGYIEPSGNASMTVDTANRLLSLGVEGVITSVNFIRIAIPHFNPATGKYVAPDRFLFRPLYTRDAEVSDGSEILPSDDIRSAQSRGNWLPPQNSVNYLSGIMVVCLPYKAVSNQKHILQEYCSCFWISLPDA